MDPPDFQQRLSQISTAWTLVAKAHGGDLERESAAQAALVERYQSAVYRYLLAAVRDPNTADDLFQEFALRLVRGDFGRADSWRGRFRNYVKTALINLVINHQKKHRRQPAPIPTTVDPAAPEAPGFDADEEFLTDWRKALLDQTWEAFAAAQNPGGPPFHAALRLRSEKPDFTTAQLAEALTAQLQPAEPLTEVGLRKLLQRAREKFTDLLVAEVARSLQISSPQDLEQELIDLGFYAYCRRALERRANAEG